MYQPGVMFWADRDTIGWIKSIGVRCGQVGVPGSMQLTDAAANHWKAEIDRENFTLVTVFAAFEGEEYADIPTVESTVGFIPRATRDLRERRMFEVCDFAARLGAPGLACHIGFVPEDKSNPDYIAVRDLVRRICDHCASHGQTFALETGQEAADVLLSFFRDVDRDNLRINFDPANLIMYGLGDPIEALRILGPHVISVHAKDGDPPPKGVAGALGTERPLGQGSVGIERFVRALEEVGFRGPLNIERETEDQEQRLRDITSAVSLVRGITGAAA